MTNSAMETNRVPHLFAKEEIENVEQANKNGNKICWNCQNKLNTNSDGKKKMIIIVGHI